MIVQREHKGQKPPSRRQLRVAEIVRHRLAELLFQFPVQSKGRQIELMITITAVSMSPDLKQGRVFVRAFHARRVPKNWLEQLCLARFAIRSAMAKELELKFTPNLTFVEDQSFNYAHRIESLIASDRRKNPVDYNSADTELDENSEE